MAKKKITYSDLTNKELELLKEVYIYRKVESMNANDLKDFATENISLQIKNTIGNDEEQEAWREMEEFFKDEFDNTILDIQIKIRSNNGRNTKINTEQIKQVSEDKGKEKKLDMWDD